MVERGGSSGGSYIGKRICNLPRGKLCAVPAARHGRRSPSLVMSGPRFGVKDLPAIQDAIIDRTCRNVSTLNT
jgi:hypothetical protein